MSQQQDNSTLLNDDNDDMETQHSPDIASQPTKHTKRKRKEHNEKDEKHYDNDDNNSNNSNNNNIDNKYDGQMEVVEDENLNTSTSSDDSTTNLEGISLDHITSLPRTKKCQILLNTVQKNGIVLVRSPPCSGKTSMCTCLEKYATTQTYSVYTASMLHQDTRTEPDPDYVLNKDTKKTLKAWCKYATNNKDTKILLIIDESQDLYCLGPSHPFWKQIKTLMNPKYRPANLSVVLFASYGNSPERDSSATNSGNVTPFDFPFCFGIDFLCLDESEFKDFMDRENKDRGQCGNYLVRSSTRALLKDLTGGHVGLLRWSLNKLRSFHMHWSKDEAKREKQVNSMLLSSRFLDSLSDSNRIFPTIKFSDDEKEVILKLLHNPHCSVTIPNSLKTAASKLTKWGFIALTDTAKAYRFPSPITRLVMMSRLFQTTGRNDCTSLDEFLMTTISHFSPRTLENSVATGKNDVIFERHFQMEFYRCAVDCFEDDLVCSPDVGRRFGSSGAIDFFINRLSEEDMDNGLSWGVEIVRNSSNLKEHIDRFTGPDGKYSKLPIGDNWIVLNFITPNNKSISFPKRNNVWNVHFGESYKSVRITKFGDDKIYTIPLYDKDVEMKEEATILQKKHKINNETLTSSKPIFKRNAKKIKKKKT